MIGELASSRGHTRVGSATKLRWCTPLSLFRAVHARYGFMLDAAAEPASALCPRYLSAAGRDCLVAPWALYCLPNWAGERWAWCNPPWGPRSPSFPGTRAYTRRALEQAETLTGVVLLLPTAPDTIWWRELFEAASDVRLLPRIAFYDADTGVRAASPPGGGCTLFELRSSRSARTVALADALGNVLPERS